MDQAIPLVYNALANNEGITGFTQNFWRPSLSGSEVLYFVMLLTNASIGWINGSLTTPQDPAQPAVTREEIGFTYQRIERNWTNGGIVADVAW